MGCSDDSNFHPSLHPHPLLCNFAVPSNCGQVTCSTHDTGLNRVNCFGQWGISRHDEIKYLKWNCTLVLFFSPLPSSWPHAWGSLLEDESPATLSSQPRLVYFSQHSADPWAGEWFSWDQNNCLAHLIQSLTLQTCELNRCLLFQATLFWGGLLYRIIIEIDNWCPLF